MLWPGKLHRLILTLNQAQSVTLFFVKRASQNQGKPKEDEGLQEGFHCAF